MEYSHSMGNDDRNSGNRPDLDEYEDDGTELLGADLVDAIDAAIGQRSTRPLAAVRPSRPQPIELDSLQIEPLPNEPQPARRPNEPRPPRRPLPNEPQRPREPRRSTPAPMEEDHTSVVSAKSVEATLRARLAAARSSVPPSQPKPQRQPSQEQGRRPPQPQRQPQQQPQQPPPPAEALPEIEFEPLFELEPVEIEPVDPYEEPTGIVSAAQVSDVMARVDPHASVAMPEVQTLQEDSYGDDEATDLLFADEVAHVADKIAQARGPQPPRQFRNTEERVDDALAQLRRMRQGKEDRPELQALREVQVQAVLEEESSAEDYYDYSEDATGVAYAEEVVQIAGGIGAASRFSPADTTSDRLEDALGHLQRLRDGSEDVHRLRESQYNSLAEEPSVADEYDEDLSAAFAEEVVAAARERALERGDVAPAEPLNADERVDKALVQLERLAEERKPKNEKLDRLREAQMNAVLGASWEDVKRGVDQEKLADEPPRPWRARSALGWALGLSTLAAAMTLWIVSLMWWPAIAAIAVYALLWGVPASVVAFRGHQTRLRRAVLSIVVYIAFAGAAFAWSVPDVRITTLRLTRSVMSPEHFLRVLHDPSEKVVIAACADAGRTLDLATVLRRRAASNPTSALRCARQIGNEEERARVIGLLADGWAEQIRTAGRCEGLEAHIQAFLASEGIENAAGARAVIELTLRADSEEVASCLADAIPTDDEASLTARLGDPNAVTAKDGAIFAGMVEEAFLDNPIAAALGATSQEAQIWTLRLGCQLLQNDPTDLSTVDQLNGIASAMDGSTEVTAEGRTWLGWCAEFRTSLTIEDLRRKVRYDQVATAVGAAQAIVHAALKRKQRNKLFGDMERGAARVAKYEADGSMYDSPEGAPRVYMDGANDVLMYMAGGKDDQMELREEVAGQDDEQFCKMAKMRTVFSSTAMPGALTDAFGEDKPEDTEEAVERGAMSDEEASDKEYRETVKKRCGEDFFEQELEFPGIEPGTEWTGPDD